jgi:hypothetical protein
MMLVQPAPLLKIPSSATGLNDAHFVTASHLCHTTQILNFISSPIQYRFSFSPSRLGKIMEKQNLLVNLGSTHG